MGRVDSSKRNVGGQHANKESSEVFDIIKPGRWDKIKGYRQ